MFRTCIYILSLLGSICLSISAKAQAEVETRLCYADTTTFSFTGEWQYLSTDIYLFNGSQFSRVINEMSFSLADGKKKSRAERKRGMGEERLEFLMITAQLQNVRFFGDKDIVYPLYNFQINTDRDKKYQTFVSDNIEAIRIIDNLPLYSAGDRIDAKIAVQAISQNNRDQLFSFIGSQLRSISSLANPVGAVFSLINEFGKFIESSSRKKEYRFSSTIRLFEQKNFDTRLHSVRIYQLLPSGASASAIPTDSLTAHIHRGSNAELTRPLLLELLPYSEYPFIVVANYKSLYRMQPIRGDEVNQTSIDKRKLRIENSFQSGLINEYTYKQEKDFISFLNLFSDFKAKLELYNMNFKMGNIDAAINGLSDLSRQYGMLLKTYDEADFKYRNDATFKSIFRSEYSAILDYADLYMDGDHNLKSCKGMIRTMLDVEKGGIPKEQLMVEEYIRNLRFSDNLKDFTQRTPEGQTIARQLTQAEAYLLEKGFATDILIISKAKPLSDNLELVEALKDKAAKTACQSCRERSMDAITAFYTRYDENRREELLNQVRVQQKQVDEKMFDYLSNAQLMEQNLTVLDSTSVGYGLAERYVKDFRNDTDSLNAMLTDNINSQSFPFINAYVDKLRYLQLRLDERLEFISRQRPELLLVRENNRNTTAEEESAKLNQQ